MSDDTNRWKGPRYLAYDTYDARLRSFFTWPKYLNPTPTALSTAGFCYSGKTIFSNKYSQNVSSHTILYSFFSLTTGTSDITTCFHCGVGLHDWMPEYNVWGEHGAW